MLTLKHINKSYGNRTILSDISLSIRKGEIVSILGPSGCGKTTLLNLILGLTQATSGKIMFDGEDLTNVPMQKRGFNIVFQDFALFPEPLDEKLPWTTTLWFLKDSGLGWPVTVELE